LSWPRIPGILYPDDPAAASAWGNTLALLSAERYLPDFGDAVDGRITLIDDAARERYWTGPGGARRPNPVWTALYDWLEELAYRDLAAEYPRGLGA